MRVSKVEFGLNINKPTRSLFALVCSFIAFIACSMVFSSALIAGGTSENLILIVNSESDSSKRIANHYIHWRNIPPTNVIYLSGIPEAQQITIEQFRNLILKPVISEIQKRKIASQVDYLVYSSGFPTRVSCASDLKKIDTGDNADMKKLLRGTASLNAVTYYLQTVLAEQPGYISLDGNWYFRKKTARSFNSLFIGPDEEIYQAGLSAYRKTQYRDALGSWKELVEKYPDNYLLLYQIARCHGQMGNVSDAGLALNAAAAKGWNFGTYTQIDSAFSKIKTEESFKSVLKSIGSESFTYMPTRGFRSRYAWQPNGVRATGKHTGRKYFLSTLLAVTTGRGNSDEEALAALKAAVDADYTHPTGKFYFTKTGDVRSKTRLPNFADAVRALQKLGYKSEIVTTKVPNGKDDILGATVGVSTFNWKKSQSRILPGAICENLTSFGGKMDTKAKQTPLTEFIKNGAAGSSGTVVEPYAVQFKFPHPMIHVHYAKGATLAEAFYQSVQGPFQLLIVGDPLCQPFAKPPRFTLSGIRADQTVDGKVEITLEPKVEDSISHFEIFFDGQFRANLDVGRKLAFETKQITNGHHEFSIVAVANTPLETRSRKSISFWVATSGETPSSGFTFESDANRKILAAKFQFTAKMDGAEKIEILHNHRVIGKTDASKGRIDVPCKNIGGGPVTIYARATIKGKQILSKPLELEVK